MSLPDINAELREIQAWAYRRDNPASYMVERISKMIAQFEARIGEASEVRIELAGSTVPPFHLRAIDSSNPDVVIFAGKDSAGGPVMLMQHHSQMSVLLSAAPKLEDKPFRIGFMAKADD